MSEGLQVFLAVAAIISVFVSLLTAASSARQSAFVQLDSVVTRLQKELYETKAELKEETRARETMQQELGKETIERMKYARWARRLVRQLESHVPPIEPVPFDTDPNIPNPVKDVG